MDSYKQIIREMAQATLDEGLLSPADITPRIKNCQSIIRYATGPEFSKVRMQAQADMVVLQAQQQAHETGSLSQLMELAKQDEPASVPVQAVAAAPVPAQQPEVTFQTLFEEYAQASLKAGRWKAMTERNNRSFSQSIISAMKTAWNGSTDCANRSLADWESLQDAFLDNDNSAVTVNKYISVCSAVMKRVETKRIGSNELPRMMALKEDGSDRGAYTPEQTKQLIQHCIKNGANSPALSQAIIIAAITGMRLNEILGLLPEDFITQDGKVVGIRVKDNERRTLKTKESQRFVPTPVWPKGWQPDPHLFASNEKYRGDSGAMSTAYRRYMLDHHPELLLDAEGKKLVFHSHRNAAITRCHRAGVLEQRIAELMGQSMKTEAGKTYLQAATSLADVAHLVEVAAVMNKAVL